MAESTQKMELPEKPHFNLIGSVVRNVNREVGNMGKADGARGGGPVVSMWCCGQTLCLELVACVRRSRGEKQKEPCGPSRLLQPLAWVQLRVCFPTLHEPFAQQSGSSMMYGRFPAR